MLIALTGGTIYVSPGDEPIRGGVVVIDDGSIAAAGQSIPIPPDAQVIDCSGLTITAGFWNSHVHFFERKWANAASIPAAELERQLRETFTRFGFTSVFDLSSLWENTRLLRERIEGGEVDGPAIRSTGEGLVPPGALPSDEICAFMGLMKTPMPEVTDAEQTVAAVRTLLGSGVDAIKLFLSSQRGTTIPGDAIAAAVAEAHGAGRPVFVHPNNGADVLAACRAGVDIVGHTTPRSGPWDELVLAAMAEARVALTPTLSIWKYFLRHDRLSVQEQVVGTAVGQLRAWVERGGTVLFGTDLGAVDPDPGEELTLMRAAGMTFAQMLASLTTAPAQRFGVGDRLGRVAAGFQADLVAFEGELGRVRYTWRAGKLIHEW